MGKGADLKQKGAKITLDKERTLLFDLNALVELEEAYGTINEAFEGLQKGSLKAVRALLYAALKHEDDNLTEKQVGQLVGIASVEMISGKIVEAFDLSMPEVDEKK